MLNFPCHKMELRAFYFLFIETIWVKHWEDDVGLLGLALQSNSSNCHANTKQWWSYLLSIREIYNPTVHYLDNTLYKSMYDTYPQTDFSLRPSKALWMASWSQSLLAMYVEKQHPPWVETLAQSSTCRMDTRETPDSKATNAAAPHRVPRDNVS